MENKAAKRRILVSVIVVAGLVVLWQALEAHCYEPFEILEINTPLNINYLYPKPGAEIPFVCHTIAFLKSPFAPRTMHLDEMVFKEDGFLILGGHRRAGVVNADVSIAGDLLPVFDEPMRYGKMPLFVKSTSLYVDGKKLQMGHVGWRELDLEFNFATILNPFLLPGEHVARIVILLPSGEILEYEWKFEITWW